MRAFKVLVVLLLLQACSFKPSIDDAKLSTADFGLVEFFEGETVAYGQFQDVLGNVSRRFKVNITGEWDGQRLRLVEVFTYADGSTEQRIWTLTQGPDGIWNGGAEGVQGRAFGEIKGDMFYWSYTIDLPTENGTLRVSFDDYMWMLDDNRVLNIAYMSKYGVRLGQVTIMFEK
jgi:hypothetical protein